MISPAYVAGLFDGEGSVSLRVRRNNPKVVSLRCTITSTNTLILPMVAQKFGGTINPYRAAKANHKPAVRWTVNGRLAVKFLRAVLPYLIIKKPQARLGLVWKTLRRGFCRSNPVPLAEARKRRRLVLKMHKLNKRGL